MQIEFCNLTCTTNVVSACLCVWSEAWKHRRLFHCTHSTHSHIVGDIYVYTENISGYIMAVHGSSDEEFLNQNGKIV